MLADGSLLNLKNVKFDTLLQELPDADFCRINKKEIVAVKAIKFFNHNEIVLHHLEENNKNTSLILSETYRSDFLKKVKL